MDQVARQAHHEISSLTPQGRRPSVQDMTQDERWLARYNEVKDFIETNHRNPSKYYDEEKLMVHFLKRGRKLMNAGELQEPRLGMFKELLGLGEQNKHKNQYE